VSTKIYLCTIPVVCINGPVVFLNSGRYVVQFSDSYDSLSLFFPSFVRLIDVFNTLLVFSTLLSLL
jgi:hypothetical protein